MRTKRPRLSVSSLCALAVVACAAPAEADAPDPAHPFSYELRAHTAMNPGSLYLQGGAQYRRALYASDDALLAQNEVSLLVGLGFSPASFRPLLRLTIQPLSILRLWIGYEGEGYFGVSGFARSFHARRITRFRASDKYTLFRVDGVEHIVRDSLEKLEERFGPLGFLRVHRAELVRKDAVVALTSEPGGATLELIDGQHVAVSRRYLAAAKHALGVV